MEPSLDNPAQPQARKAELRRDEGVETLEVALIGVLTVIVIMLAVPPLVTGVGTALQGVATAIQTAGAPLAE
jgi:hypothetical protein